MTNKTRTRKPARPRYLKYLQPGALARLRDSRINAKLHRAASVSTEQLKASYLNKQQRVITVMNDPPCFSPVRSSPCVLQGKKIAAVNSIICFSSSPAVDVTPSNNQIPSQ